MGGGELCACAPSSLFAECCDGIGLSRIGTDVFRRDETDPDGQALNESKAIRAKGDSVSELILAV
jgi:hypothetical protein